jgi:dTDP-4-dehydrorhamnose 3,5-epimerase-like enzyme
VEASVTAEGVTIHELNNSGDVRGRSYPVSNGWLADAFAVRSAHITTVKSGHLRGNHFHAARREVLIIQYTDDWSVHWDTGEGTEVRRRTFRGEGTVVLEISPHSSHAVRNDGSQLLFVVGLADAGYDADLPDARPRVVVD